MGERERVWERESECGREREREREREKLLEANETPVAKKGHARSRDRTTKIDFNQGCAIMIERDRSSNDRRLDRSQGSVRRSIEAAII